MLFHSQETQEHMEMAHEEIPKERTKEAVEEITEEQFLKDLYLFMKKRDTPIERIPHLGFKQIDLFVMFKTVRDLGGYHQVTAQQLWKQVYNTLGGNPRSTSAATCTRRHYEKLLLPYECHVKGIMMNTLPQSQPKHFLYHSVRDHDDDCPRPAKRKLIPIPLHQSLFKPDPHGKIFPMPLHYPPYYAPSHTVLPPYVPMPPAVMAPHSPPAPKPHFPVHSFSPRPHPNLTSSDSVKGPLEHLRGLADKYKNLAGLAEPLNLSVKASSQETNQNPVSSFSAPSSKKKFLNKPSSLYNPHQLQVVKNGEAKDEEAAVEGTPYSYQEEEEKDAYIVDVKPAPGSPAYSSGPTLRAEEDTTTMGQKNSSPKPDFQSVWPKEERDGSPELKRLNLSHILPNLPRENGGKMEIEIPLSVLHKWLRMCQVEPSLATHGPMQLTVLPNKEGNTKQRSLSEPEVLTNNLPPQMNPHHLSPSAEDLRLRRRNVPSPITINKVPHPNNTSPNHFTSYKPLSAGGPFKNTPSNDCYAVEQQNNVKSFNSRPPSFWSPYDIETKTLKTSPGPITVHQDYPVTKPCSEDIPKSGKEGPEMGPSTVLMVNSIPSSVLHLTTEEVMKLKKIISSSS